MLEESSTHFPAGIGMGHEVPPVRIRHPFGVGAVVAIVSQGWATAPKRLRLTLG